MPDEARQGNFDVVAVRMFGWLMLALVTAFLINNFLTFGLKFPGALSVYNGQGGGVAEARVLRLIYGDLIYNGTAKVLTEARGIQSDAAIS